MKYNWAGECAKTVSAQRRKFADWQRCVRLMGVCLLCRDKVSSKLASRLPLPVVLASCSRPDESRCARQRKNSGSQHAGRHATCHAPQPRLLDWNRALQQDSASGCEHCGDTSDSFTTDHRFPRCAVFSFRAPQAAAAPFCRCNAWPSATMLRLEARFFAPNVRCVWPCPWPGCRNETWQSVLLRHTQQREQTCRGENVSRHAKKS